MVYVKLFVDYLDAIEPLGDAERGRLFTALMEYARSGEVPQLGGNERFIFPMMKAQLDRDIASSEEAAERSRENGKKGGRPKKPTETQENQVGFEKPRETHNKDKDKDKDKEEDKDKSNKRTRKSFVPPTFDEVADYVFDRNSPVDPKAFWEYYEAGNWKDGKGEPVRNWKQKLLTWEKHDKPRAQEIKPKSFAQMWREMQDDET